MSAFDKQVGGTHYKDLAIQPTEYCQKNHLGFCESSVVKYVTRHRLKNGRADIEKAIHFLELLLELEYSEEANQKRDREAHFSKPYQLDDPAPATEPAPPELPIPYEVVEGLDEVKPVKQAENENWEYFTGEEALANQFERTHGTEWLYPGEGKWWPIVKDASWNESYHYRRPKKPLSTDKSEQPNMPTP